MNDIKKDLEKYLKLEISKEDMLKHSDIKDHNDSLALVSVSLENIKDVISAGISTRVTKYVFSEWVDFIWFSGYYDYEDKNQEAIAQIMNDLEDIDQLSDEEYLNLLKHIKMEILDNKYRKIYK